MTIRRRALALGVVLLATSGCTGLKGVVQALAKDPATVCASYLGIYGNLQVSRTALPSGKVTCSKDGLSVESVPAK